MRLIDPIWSSINTIFRTGLEKSESDFFKGVLLFQDLSSREVKKLMKLMHVRRFKDGEYVFHKGQPGTAFYIIRKGAVRVVQPGEELMDIAELQEGDLFGELSILDDTPRSASVLTKGETELRAIFKGDFDKLMVSEPTIAAKIYRRVAIIIGIRLKVTNDQLLKNVRRDAEPAK